MSIEKLLEAAKYSSEQIAFYRSGKCFCYSDFKPSLYFFGIYQYKTVLLYCNGCLSNTYKQERNLIKLTDKEHATLLILK